MRQIRNAVIALAAIGGAALVASTASAQYAPYRYNGGPTYSYGADRANPSFSPRGFDQDDPRDQQLQGSR